MTRLLYYLLFPFLVVFFVVCAVFGWHANAKGALELLDKLGNQ